MANRSHLVALRGGTRSVATRLINNLNTIFANEEPDLVFKLHNLETKLQDLQTRLRTIEDLDQQIVTLTEADKVEEEMEAADTINTPIQDALSRSQHRINVLRKQVKALHPNLYPTAQQDPVSTPVRASSNHLTPFKRNYPVVNLLKQRFKIIPKITPVLQGETRVLEAEQSVLLSPQQNQQSKSSNENQETSGEETTTLNSSVCHINPMEDRHEETLQDLPVPENPTLALPYSGQHTFNVNILIEVDYYRHIVEDETPIPGQGPTVVNLVSSPLNSVQLSKTKQAINSNIQAVDCADLSLIIKRSVQNIALLATLLRLIENQVKQNSILKSSTGREPSPASKCLGTSRCGKCLDSFFPAQASGGRIKISPRKERSMATLLSIPTLSVSRWKWLHSV